MNFSGFVESMVNAVAPMVSDGSVTLYPPSSLLKTDAESLDLILDADAPVGSSAVTIRDRVGKLEGTVYGQNLIRLGEESRWVASTVVIGRHEGRTLDVPLSSPLTVEALAGDSVTLENPGFEVEHSTTVSRESYPHPSVSDVRSFSFQMPRKGVIPSADWFVERRTTSGDVLEGRVSHVDISGPIVLVLVGRKPQRR